MYYSLGAFDYVVKIEDITGMVIPMSKQQFRESFSGEPEYSFQNADDVRALFRKANILLPGLKGTSLSIDTMEKIYKHFPSGVAYDIYEFVYYILELLGALPKEYELVHVGKNSSLVLSAPNTYYLLHNSYVDTSKKLIETDILNDRVVMELLCLCDIFRITIAEFFSSDTKDTNVLVFHSQPKYFDSTLRYDLGNAVNDWFNHEFLPTVYKDFLIRNGFSNEFIELLIYTTVHIHTSSNFIRVFEGIHFDEDLSVAIRSIIKQYNSTGVCSDEDMFSIFPMFAESLNNACFDYCARRVKYSDGKYGLNLCIITKFDPDDIKIKLKYCKDMRTFKHRVCLDYCYYHDFLRLINTVKNKDFLVHRAYENYSVFIRYGFEVFDNEDLTFRICDKFVNDVQAEEFSSHAVEYMVIDKGLDRNSVSLSGKTIDENSLNEFKEMFSEYVQDIEKLMIFDADIIKEKAQKLYSIVGTGLSSSIFSVTKGYLAVLLAPSRYNKVSFEDLNTIPEYGNTYCLIRYLLDSMLCGEEDDNSTELVFNFDKRFMPLDNRKNRVADLLSRVAFLILFRSHLAFKDKVDYRNMRYSWEMTEEYLSLKFWYEDSAI